MRLVTILLERLRAVQLEKSRVALWVLVFSSIPSLTSASRRTEMYRMEPQPYHVAAGVTKEQISEGIAACARHEGWRTSIEDDGTVEAEMIVHGGKHSALVGIRFDEKTVLIDYVDSFNLGYQEEHCRAGPRSGSPLKRSRHLDHCIERIHPHYNLWVRRLENDLPRCLGRLKASDVPAARKRDDPSAFVADELLKLKKLRDAGVLSEEEFELQKKRVLDSAN